MTGKSNAFSPHPTTREKLSETPARRMVGSTLLWLRKGLRLHDNPALCAAIEGTSNLYPVFCLDPWFVKSGRIGANRMNFLLEVRLATLLALRSGVAFV